MKNVLVYGTGKTANYMIKRECSEIISIKGVIDKYKEDDIWEGYKVYKPEDIHKVKYDEIWLCSSYIEAYEECINVGVNKEKLVISNAVLFEKYSELNDGIVDIRYRKRESDEYETYVATQHNVVSIRSMNRYLDVEGFIKDSLGNWYNAEYVRYATLKLLAEEIKRNNVEGATAELGVYKGDFARLINKEFDTRKLYLFDTFNGFDSRDVDKEINEGFTSSEYAYIGNYADTTEKAVLYKMLYPEQCVIRKGFFPDTIPEEEINYAFVSIDCDMYSPVLAGIKYFYPRLCQGGYIMIHDYNNDERWKGIKVAIEEYEYAYGKICKVPIPDIGGSIILTK